MFPINRNHRASGFGLVEIMVSMVIGMFGIIIMMQLFSMSEGQKRATTGADDAQNNGAIALYGLQRDILQGGFGAADVRLLGCDVLLRTGVTLRAMAPVTINPAAIPAGDANTDTLLVVYGNSNGSPQGDGITSQPATTSYAVQTPTSFFGNDNVIALPQIRPAACSLLLDQVASVTAPDVTVTSGAAGMTNGTLFNLGQAPRILAYAIRGGNLTVCDYLAVDCSIAQGAVSTATWQAMWTPIASNIVSMRAEYGRDTSVPMDAIVDVYDQSTPVTACAWSAVYALRVALVARNAQFDKNTLTPNAPVWIGAVPLDLSADANWQHYRYKVFQTVVPIRNVAWLGAQC